MEQIKDEKYINKYSNRRFWFGFVSIFPLSIFFLMGIFWNANYIQIILNLHEYETGFMKVDKLDFIPIPEAPGNPSVVGLGTVKGVKTSIDIGDLESQEYKKFLNNIYEKDSLIQVWYKEDGNLTFKVKENETFLEFVSRIFKRAFVSFSLLNLPFLSCLFLHFYYKKKERRLKNKTQNG